MILERYIIRNYVGPFFFSISIITFLFIMDFILRYIDLFLNKGVEFLVVLQTFILSLGHMFALIIPMAVLPATLMTFGNLSSENEITAMRASGVSLYRMILPGVVMASLLTFGMILYNNHVLPESNHKLLNLLIDINKKKPTVEIKANVFISAFKDYTIYVRHKDDKTGQIRDIQIFRYSKPGALPTTIVAEKGRLEYIERSQLLRFELENGEIHEMPQGNDPSTYRRTEFKHYVINIDDIDRSLKRSERKYRGDREMNVKQMKEKIEAIRSDIAGVDLKMADLATSQAKAVFRLLDATARDSLLGGAASSQPAGAPSTRARRDSPTPRLEVSRATAKANAQAMRSKSAVTYRALESQREIKESYFRQINRYRVEIHKKFSIPFACVIFVLIGSPIALRMGRSGMNMAIGLSILVFLVYYICLIGGEKLADRRIVSPAFAMWVPNVIFGVAAIALIRRASAEQSVIRWTRFNPFRSVKRTS
ncbi:MAG: LptF/LptG family permease [Candidatus Krumholzibacteria bacterium]|nr:LptF/LptG family permease [Candidatus Krumholzibacteria bacterium]